MQENASIKIKYLKELAYYAFIMYNYEIQTGTRKQGSQKCFFSFKEKLTIMKAAANIYIYKEIRI